jgi:inner membrane protein
MDSLTHIAVGACLGEVLLGKKLGKPALLWGALAQNLPDIDVISVSWLNPAQSLLAHRGITHSIFFALAISPLLAWTAGKVHHPKDISFRRWTLFFLLQICVHILLDAFNSYGTGWFEPFSHFRVSFNAIFVADPLFTLMPLVATVALLTRPSNIRYRKRFARFALGCSFFYLLLSFWNKGIVDTDVQVALKNQNIQYNRYFTTPAPLNNLLWLVIAETDSGYHITYRSVFDRNDSIHFNFYNRNAYLLLKLKDRDDVNRLITFSRGYYSVENLGDTLMFNDLRFGQVMGWMNPYSPFVFHYYLEKAGNETVMQRGRLSGWSRNAFRDLIKRMFGY